MENKDILKAWLDGAEMQYRPLNGGAWQDKSQYKNEGYFMFNFEDVEYRIKPETRTLTYRLALFKNPAGDNYWTETWNKGVDYNFEEIPYFIRWLTDEQTVEI